MLHLSYTEQYFEVVFIVQRPRFQEIISLLRIGNFFDKVRTSTSKPSRQTNSISRFFFRSLRALQYLISEQEGMFRKSF